MQVFVDWLAAQPGTDPGKRRFDPATLYARAFEYTATGAAFAETAQSQGGMQIWREVRLSVFGDE